jgi:Putative DNA-binding domain
VPELLDPWRKNVAFEGLPLRDLTEAHIQGLISAGVAEHLYLEYKSELYADNRDGRKEGLLDLCMFANAQGGVLLIGVSEQRDSAGQPTGLPDPAAELGIFVENPESLLQAYDGRVASCIEERLNIESHAIPVGGGRHVLAFRIPDSIKKPHCVRLEGHIYFPIRRERNRYPMDVREIKDLAMRAASQLERAEALMASTLVRGHSGDCILTTSVVPVFFSDFLLDFKHSAIYQAFGNFHMNSNQIGFVAPTFTLEGLRRNSARSTMTLGRNGVFTMETTIPTKKMTEELHGFYLTAIDLLLRRFVEGAQLLYSAGAVPSPVLLGISMTNAVKLGALYHECVEEPVQGPGSQLLPLLPIANIFEPVDRLIRPLCDIAHQAFGNAQSPCFNADGSWRDPN